MSAAHSNGRCHSGTRCRRRIEEAVLTLLIEKFSRQSDSGDDGERVSSNRVSVDSDGDAVRLTVDGDRHRLSRTAAAALQDRLADAMTERHEFLHTTGERRGDGSYVVERRGADSSGHRKVFDCFDAVRHLYGRLPGEFTAEDVGRSGLTGGRRHMVVRHLAEHPAFDCELASRQPLTVTKAASAESSATDEMRSVRN